MSMEPRLFGLFVIYEFRTTVRTALERPAAPSSPSFPGAHVTGDNWARLIDGGENPEGQLMVLGQSPEQVVALPGTILRHIDHHTPGKWPDYSQNDLWANPQQPPRPAVLRKAAAGNVHQKVRAEPRRVDTPAARLTTAQHGQAAQGSGGDQADRALIMMQDPSFRGERHRAAEHLTNCLVSGRVVGGEAPTVG